jgi:hypothetical protein
VEQQHQDSFGCARTSSALLRLCLQTMDAMQSLSFAEGASGSPVTGGRDFKIDRTGSVLKIDRFPIKIETNLR